jgi:hypothetical protein
MDAHSCLPVAGRTPGTAPGAIHRVGAYQQTRMTGIALPAALISQAACSEEGSIHYYSTEFGIYVSMP